MTSSWFGEREDGLGLSRWIDFTSAKTRIVIPSHIEIAGFYSEISGSNNSEYSFNVDDANEFYESTFVKNLFASEQSEPFRTVYCFCESKYLLDSKGNKVPRMRVVDLMQINKQDIRLINILYNNSIAETAERDGIAPPVAAVMTCPTCGEVGARSNYQVTAFVSSREPQNASSELVLSIFAARNKRIRKGLEILASGNVLRNELADYLSIFYQAAEDTISLITPSVIKGYHSALEAGVSYPFIAAMSPLLLDHKSYGRSSIKDMLSVTTRLSKDEFEHYFFSGMPSLSTIKNFLDNGIDASLFGSLMHDDNFLALSAAWG